MDVPPELEDVRHTLAVDDRQTVEDFSHGPWDLDADRLRASYGDGAFERVVLFLADPDVGYSAAQTLLVLDHDRAVSSILGAAKDVDRNVRHVGFSAVRRTGSALTTGSWREPARLAGLVVLADRDANADSVVEALEVVGLTGTLVDAPLLVPFLEPAETNAHWHAKIHHAALGSLARLRYVPATEALHTQVRAALADPSPTLDALWAASESIANVAFAEDPAFVAELCALLSYPTHAPEREGCTYPASARQAAAVAILTLAGAPPRDLEAQLSPDVDAAAAWCASR